jgi:HD-like signal output (HDOD) protein
MAKLRYDDYVSRDSRRPRGTAAGSHTGVADVRPSTAEVDAAIRRLPALPALLHELMRELRDADADIKHLEERISSDASLTTRVLKMANSPFYVRSGEVVDVGRAVMTLGFRTVANLVMAAGLRNTMGPSLAIPTFQSNGVFMFSLASGLACARLPRKVAALRDVADEMFVAGLLHDVGRIAMSEFYPRVKREIEANAASALEPVSEHRLLGIDHQQVGGLVHQRWGLPEELLGAITRHHEPVEAIADDPIVLGVAVVDATIDQHGYARTCRNPNASGRVETLCRALGTDTDVVEDVIASVEDEVSSIAGSFG